MVLNTSFNIAGEPIVCTPDDAIRTFVTSGLNALILGLYLVIK
jgi:carbamoyltransferase